jgi:hypothetical protein
MKDIGRGPFAVRSPIISKLGATLVCTEKLFRKRLQYWRPKFLVRVSKFPIPTKKFPVLLCREFRWKTLILPACQRLRTKRVDSTKFPILFPVSRKFGSTDGFRYNCLRDHFLQGSSVCDFFIA